MYLYWQGGYHKRAGQDEIDRISSAMTLLDWLMFWAGNLQLSQRWSIRPRRNGGIMAR